MPLPTPEQVTSAATNVSRSTGSASDYLDHFSQAIFLLELLAVNPDCGAPFQAWRPRTYQEPIASTHGDNCHAAIPVHDPLDAAARARLDELAHSMNAVLAATRETMQQSLPTLATGMLANRAAAWLRPLVAEAAAVIAGAAVRGTADGRLEH